MKHRPLFVAGTAAAVLLPVLAVTAPSSVAAPSRQRVPGTAPSWVAATRASGHADPQQVLHLRFTLSPRDAAGAEAFATSVSEPSSASYGRYLAPSAYAQRFGPTADAVSAVRAYVASSGLRVDAVSGDAVSASGPVSVVEQALGTTLNLYAHGGRQVRAAAADVTVPTSIAPLVTSISGLTASTGAIHPNTKNADGGPIKTPTVGTPCSSYYGQNTVSLPSTSKTFEGVTWFDHVTAYPTSVCGYSPSQLRTTYGLSAATTSSTGGAGQTVAIIDAYALPTMLQDANTYSSNYNLPALTSSTYKEYLPAGGFTEQTACGEEGWWGEEALDVDAVHSMAPGAGIVYVPASSCEDSDFLGAYDTILTGTGDSPLATIVSNSYGDTGEDIDPATRDAEHNYFVRGATEGVGFYFSSGDDGDDSIDGLTPQPDASANDPAVTAVGGTSLGVAKDGSRVFETGWGNQRTVLNQDSRTKAYTWADSWSFYAGAGGGTSAVWAEPGYQKGIVPAALAQDRQTGSRRGRVVPDIAADADPYTGFISGYSTPSKKGPVYSEGDIGGTSLAAPLVAGFMATAQQVRGKGSFGFANPLLYSSVRTTLNDVNPGSTLAPAYRGVVYKSAAAGVTRLVAFDQDSSLVTAKGYDRVTGLGTPSKAFLAALAGS